MLGVVCVCVRGLCWVYGVCVWGVCCVCICMHVLGVCVRDVVCVLGVCWVCVCMHACVLGVCEMGTVNQSLQSNAEGTLVG